LTLETMIAHRPHVLPAAPSPEEAAAIVAAIERFMRATARAPAPAPSDPDPWLRAAILEGVAREDGGGAGSSDRSGMSEPWINP
jgi:hypothetical protein